MLNSPVAHAPADLTLRGIPEIRQFFRTNETPIYFISPTAFNLLGIDRWVRNLFYVTFFDSFEGAHPRVVVPSDRSHREFLSIEDVCNHLLRDPEILAWMAARGPGGKAAFVMFDAETEALAAKAGLEVIHPPAALRARLDSKLVTTRLADEAGLPSVPNTIARATSYEELMTLLASPAVQTNATEYRKHSKALSEIQPLVERFREYKDVVKEAAQAEELAKGADPDMRELATEELRGLERRRDTLLAEMKQLLIPKDPNDQKNIMLEIRAGTGGDEAALFAYELFRMYERYAERRRWKVEIVDRDDTGI